MNYAITMTAAYSGKPKTLEGMMDMRNLFRGVVVYVSWRSLWRPRPTRWALLVNTDIFMFGDISQTSTDCRGAAWRLAENVYLWKSPQRRVKN